MSWKRLYPIALLRLYHQICLERSHTKPNKLLKPISQKQISWYSAFRRCCQIGQKKICDRFAARVPSDLLGAIARIAKQVVKTNLSKADQLVQCVQEMLPNWAEEDLLVFARPFAYAMRGEGEAVDSTLSAIRPVDWTDLSQMEQARLSMAIASYALDSLHKASEDS